MVIDKAVSGD